MYNNLYSILDQGSKKISYLWDTRTFTKNTFLSQDTRRERLSATHML